MRVSCLPHCGLVNAPGWPVNTDTVGPEGGPAGVVLSRTAVAAVGALVAFSGLRRQRDLSVAPGDVPDVRPADLAGRRSEPAVPGELASCTAAPAALTVREPVRDSTMR